MFKKIKKGRGQDEDRPSTGKKDRRLADDCKAKRSDRGLFRWLKPDETCGMRCFRRLPNRHVGSTRVARTVGASGALKMDSPLNALNASLARRERPKKMNGSSCKTTDSWRNKSGI
jgi:hypothetical protein